MTANGSFLLERRRNGGAPKRRPYPRQDDALFTAPTATASFHTAIKSRKVGSECNDDKILLRDGDHVSAHQTHGEQCSVRHTHDLHKTASARPACTFVDQRGIVRRELGQVGILWAHTRHVFAPNVPHARRNVGILRCEKRLYELVGDQPRCPPRPIGPKPAVCKEQTDASLVSAQDRLIPARADGLVSALRRGRRVSLPPGIGARVLVQLWYSEWLRKIGCRELPRGHVTRPCRRRIYQIGEMLDVLVGVVRHRGPGTIFTHPARLGQEVTRRDERIKVDAGLCEVRGERGSEKRVSGAGRVRDRKMTERVGPRMGQSMRTRGARVIV